MLQPIRSMSAARVLWCPAFARVTSPTHSTQGPWNPLESRVPYLCGPPGIHQNRKFHAFRAAAGSNSNQGWRMNHCICSVSPLGLIFETSISLRAGSTWLIFAENILNVTLLQIIAQCGASAELLATYLPRPSQLARKCLCSAEAAQVTYRRSQNAALSEKRVCRRQGVRGQYSSDAKITVLACQNQPIQVECLRRTLKRPRITQSPIHKPKRSNSARCKVKQDIA